MDALTFITKLIESVAWPITTVILVVLLRKPIVNLLPLMKKLTSKEFELEFSQKVSELKAKADITLKEDDKNIKQDAQASDHLIDLVSYSPRAAIMEAWIELETAAVDVVSSIWNQPNKEVFRNMSNLGNYLYQNKIFDEIQLSIFNQLRKVRNKSAHAEELNVNDSDVKAYVQMAVNLTKHIRRS
jgi:hypothetical protein